jgi:hypothetical protein
MKKIVAIFALLLVNFSVQAQESGWKTEVIPTPNPLVEIVVVKNKLRDIIKKTIPELNYQGVNTVPVRERFVELLTANIDPLTKDYPLVALVDARNELNDSRYVKEGMLAIQILSFYGHDEHSPDIVWSFLIALEPDSKFVIIENSVDPKQ